VFGLRPRHGAKVKALPRNAIKIGQHLVS
jgi:hypothetical protein